MLEHAEPAPALSWLDAALARFAADNGDLAPRTRALLDVIVAEPKRHARMLNMLSLLEHMRTDNFIREGLDITFRVVTRAQDIVPTAIAAAGPRDAPTESRVASQF